MAKKVRELRDAVHVFVGFDDDERQIIDSAPFQRLRHVHQLALTYTVYPGGTHRRFEHSLGVMHLAGRIYDVITRSDKISDEVRAILPEQGKSDHGYWRTVVRMAALCHDMGHLPFSHAAEDELLPDGWDHERLTWEIVFSNEMKTIFDRVTPPVRPEDVAKLAVGGRKAARFNSDIEFSPWEGILAEVIIGDAFGADRMDYLLRDSLHTGVAYGRFDHNRLINTLCVLPDVPREPGEKTATDPVLGCERGGLQSAEQLLLARYFMFSQVYHHATRLAYNEHLKDFLKAWLAGGDGDGYFPTDVSEHLAGDDNDVLVAIKEAAVDKDAAGHDPASRIVSRNHFVSAYQRQPGQTGADPEDIELRGDKIGDVQALAEAAAQHFGADKIAFGAPPSRKIPPDFAVRDNGHSVSAKSLSEVMKNMPESPDGHVLADREIRQDVKTWILANRTQLLSDSQEGKIKAAQEAEKS